MRVRGRYSYVVLDWRLFRLRETHKIVQLHGSRIPIELSEPIQPIKLFGQTPNVPRLTISRSPFNESPFTRLTNPLPNAPNALNVPYRYVVLFPISAGFRKKVAEEIPAGRRSEAEEMRPCRLDFLVLRLPTL